MRQIEPGSAVTCLFEIDQHRAAIGEIMREDGIEASVVLEWWMWTVGRTIAFGCLVWGGRASALGATLFELNAVFEFARLAVLARKLGEPERAALFDHMAQQEDAHRAWFSAAFRGKASVVPSPTASP